MGVKKKTEWVPERYRPLLDNMTSTEIRNELVQDAVIGHLTENTRFVLAMTALATKRARRKKSQLGPMADLILKEIHDEAKEINGTGLPGRDPESMIKRYMQTGNIY